MGPTVHRRDGLSARLTTVKSVALVANSVVTVVPSVLIAAISPVRTIIGRGDMPTEKEAITAMAVSVRIMEGIVVKAGMPTEKGAITVRVASVRTTVDTVAKAVTVTVKEATTATIMVAVSVVRKAAMGTIVSAEAGRRSAVPAIMTPMPNIA